MRIKAIMTLAIAIMIACFLMTTISFFRNLGDKDMRGVNMDEIIAGKLHSLVLAPAVWKWLPRMPGDLAPCPSIFLEYKTLALMFCLAMGGLVVLRIQARRSYLAVGLFCLACGFIPYAMGRMALGINTDIPDSSYVGPWLGVMILGMLYASAACAFFVMIELWDGKFLMRLEDWLRRHDPKLVLHGGHVQ